MGHHEENRRQDRIAAVATAPGRGGIGVVRVSGPDLASVIDGVLGRRIAPRRAVHGRFLDTAGQVIDEGIAIWFPGPGSYTGEDVLELQAHGSPVVLDELMQAVLSCGARHAEPGEFTQRAYLNRRLDLAQAEAVADLIEASSARAARAAVRTLSGAFSSYIWDLDTALAELRAFVEAAIDFPDEEIDFIAESDVAERLSALETKLLEIMASARRGRLLVDGIQLVLAGAPNVGKSSLMNQLSGEEVAIVTDTAGTTRDVLRQAVNLDGYPLHLVDTAGLRESEDAIEREGIARARAAMAQADLLMLVLDDRDHPDGIGPEGLAGQSIEFDEGPSPATDVGRIVVLNKADLTGRACGVLTSGESDEQEVVRISARTGDGLAALREAIKRRAGIADVSEDDFAARRRHLGALSEVRDCVAAATAALRSDQAAELVAEDLRRAQQALATIVGERDNEQLLGLIFSRFCIGK